MGEWATAAVGARSGRHRRLVQDTLLQTFKRIDAFEPRRVGALQAYLRQAVLNRLRDELRRKGRQPPTVELDGVDVAGGQHEGDGCGRAGRAHDQNCSPFSNSRGCRRTSPNPQIAEFRHPVELSSRSYHVTITEASIPQPYKFVLLYGLSTDGLLQW